MYNNNFTCCKIMYNCTAFISTDFILYAWLYNVIIGLYICMQYHDNRVPHVTIIVAIARPSHAIATCVVFIIFMQNASIYLGHIFVESCY